MTFLIGFHPIVQALFATLFTWGVTALGAVPVFFTGGVNRRLLDSMLGMAAGVMVAASFWSLLAPAIELSGGSWIPATIGFLLGGVLLRGIDQILPHVHPALAEGQPEGLSSSWRRSTLLVLVRTFGGDTLLRRAYEHAMEERYRFFSYGDAMFIEPYPDALERESRT